LELEAGSEDEDNLLISLERMPKIVSEFRSNVWEALWGFVRWRI
jgi:hypothetical protein